MDAVKHILEAAHLRDEPQVDPNKPPVSVTSLHLCDKDDNDDDNV